MYQATVYLRHAQGFVTLVYKNMSIVAMTLPTDDRNQSAREGLALQKAIRG